MNRIKELREHHNMTQQELADKIGGAKSTIAMYEKGDRKPSLEVLIALSETFNCSIDYLMGLTSYVNPKETLEKELYSLDLTEEELNDAINCFDGEDIDGLILMLYSQNIATRESNILFTILKYVLDYFPTNENNISDIEKESLSNQIKARLKKAQELLHSLDKNKIIHNLNENNDIPEDLENFVMAYHRDENFQENIKGLSPEEISDAVRFYKEMKNRMNKDNNT